MRFKDKLYVSYILLKGNKKRIKRIVSVLIFSFTVLMISLYMVFGLYFGVMNELNKNSVDFTVKITYADYNGYINPLARDELIKDTNIQSSYRYIKYSMDTYDNWKIETDKPYYEIDGNKYEYNSSTSTIYFNIYNNNDLDNIVTNAEDAYLRKEGYDFSLIGNFSDKQNEIILPSALVDSFGIEYSQIIGKNISFYSYYSKRRTVLNDQDEKINDAYFLKKYTVFKNFIVVGVYNSNIPGYSEKSLWVKENAFSGYDSYVEENDYIYKYLLTPEELNNIVINNNEIFIAPGFCSDFISIQDSFIELYRFDKFKDSLSFYNTLNNYFEGEMNDNSIEITTLMGNYINYYPYFICIIDILIIVFVAVTLAAIINLIIIVTNELKVKKKTFFTFSANGMDKKSISSVVSIYVSLIIISSTVLSLIISSILGIVLTLIFNNNINGSIDSVFKYNLSFNYYYLSLFISIVFILTLIVNLLIFFKIYMRKKEYHI